MRGMRLSLLVVWMVFLSVGQALAITGPPEPRYETNLSVNPLPVVGELCELTLTVQALINSPNTHVSIYIPSEGVSVYGDTSIVTDISQGEVYTHWLLIGVEEEDKYNFFATIWSQNEVAGYAQSDLAELHIHSTDSTAFVYETVDQAFYATDDIIYEEDGHIIVNGNEVYEDSVFGTSSTNITVSGQIRYLNRDENTYEPLPHVKVRITNYQVFYDCSDCPTPFPLPPCLCDLLGIPETGAYPNPFYPRSEVTTTDANGCFSLSSWPSGNTMVQVLMDNGVAYIDNDQDGRFPETKRCDWASSDVVLNVNIEYSEPARILRNLYKAHRWCSDQLGWTRSKMKVNYYHGQDGGAYFSSNDVVNYYQSWGGRWEMWRDRGREVIAHEYGHAVMYEAYGETLPPGDGPSPHYINSVSSPGFALVEGWAEFFSVAVYITAGENEYGSKVHLHLESLGEQEAFWGCPYYRGFYCNNDDGQIVEGATATFLWDLYDSPSIMDNSQGEDDDVANGLAGAMWNVLQNGRLENVLGQRFHVQSIYQFHCVWNDEDPAPDILWIYQHAPGPQPVGEIYNLDLFGIETDVPQVSGANVPSVFALPQNHPNPFNPTTSITYSLPEAVHTRLEIYNLLGQKVATLVNEKQTAGYRSVHWDSRSQTGNEVSSGIYFYRLQAGDFVETRKMILLK